MATAVYLLCTVTSGVCALLLLRMYRRTRARQLLWFTLSFAAWTVASALVFTDLVVLPDVDLSILRAAVSAVAAGMMLAGLIWYGE